MRSGLRLEIGDIQRLVETGRDTVEFVEFIAFQWRCDRDAVEMVRDSQRYIRDWRCNGDVVDVQWRCSGDRRLEVVVSD
jgi:hypothetical protein